MVVVIATAAAGRDNRERDNKETYYSCLRPLNLVLYCRPFFAQNNALLARRRCMSSYVGQISANWTSLKLDMAWLIERSLSGIGIRKASTMVQIWFEVVAGENSLSNFENYISLGYWSLLWSSTLIDQIKKKERQRWLTTSGNSMKPILSSQVRLT